MSSVSEQRLQEADEGEKQLMIRMSSQKLDPAPAPHSGRAASLTAKLVSGSLGSIVTALVVTPLEVVKVRQQAGVPSISLFSPTRSVEHQKATKIPTSTKGRICVRCGTFVLNNGLMECTLPKSAVPYFDASGKLIRALPSVRRPLGTFGMLRSIFAQEGLAGVYAGLSPTLVMSVPNTVMYFTAYDEISSLLRREVSVSSHSADTWIPLVSGSSARLLASTVTSPLELIRTRQASLVGDGEAATDLATEFRTLVQRGGFQALFRGLAPTLWRDVPFSAIYWYGIEHLKASWRSSGMEPTTPIQTAGQSLFNGAVAGMVAAASTTPFDVVKTRAMVGRLSATVGKGREATGQADGLVKLMRQVVKEDGVTGLWRGNQARMYKVAPACAIMIACYEVGKMVIK